MHTKISFILLQSSSFHTYIPWVRSALQTFSPPRKVAYQISFILLQSFFFLTFIPWVRATLQTFPPHIEKFTMLLSYEAIRVSVRSTYYTSARSCSALDILHRVITIAVNIKTEKFMPRFINMEGRASCTRYLPHVL